jgi:hypothetical protein
LPDGKFIDASSGDNVNLMIFDTRTRVWKKLLPPMPHGEWNEGMAAS